MAKFFQTKEFRELYDAWMQKLSDSGFTDVENKAQGLKQNAANSYRQAEQIVREAKIEYFRTITRRVHDEEFSDQVDLTVMTLRGDGVSINDIARESGVHRQTVRYIIRRYEHSWGLRIWTAKQRNIKDG